MWPLAEGIDVGDPSSSAEPADDAVRFWPSGGSVILVEGVRDSEELENL